MRKLVLLAMLACGLAATAAGTANASSTALYGLQDDAWLRYDYQGSLTERVLKLRQLGVGIVRFTLHWNEVAPTRPADARDPSDPAYDWAAYDEIFGALNAWKMPVLVTIYGTPAWANGGRGPNWAPSSASSIAGFAYAAQRRFPWIDRWTVWNEPNKPVFLRPTTPAVYTTRLLNPAYDALHSANRHALVAGGVTAPRGGSGGVQPVTWIRGMGADHARLDAYAHHPYPIAPRETPFSGGCSTCLTLSMASLPHLLAEVHRAFGNKRIWLTEYGYQVRPADPFGVPAAVQARYDADASRRVYDTRGVDMLIHFLYRDEPSVAAWQSGLTSIRNVARPALRGFELPLSQVSRSGSSTVLWGQVRVGSGRRPFQLQEFRAGGWEPLGSTRLTDARGFLRATVRAGRGTKLRLSSEGTDTVSPLLVVA